MVNSLLFDAQRDGIERVVEWAVRREKVNSLLFDAQRDGIERVVEGAVRREKGELTVV